MIYFIQSGDEDGSGPIKIGYSATKAGCLDRLRTLQTGNADDLQLLAVMDGGKETESWFHHAFSHYRIRGEWFHPSDLLWRMIMGWILEREETHP